MSPFGIFCGLTLIEDAWMQYEWDYLWWEGDEEDCGKPRGGLA